MIGCFFSFSSWFFAAAVWMDVKTGFDHLNLMHRTGFAKMDWRETSPNRIWVATRRKWFADAMEKTIEVDEMRYCMQ